LTVQQFQTRFLRLIALTWLLPPMVGFSFLIYIEVFTLDQVFSMMTTPLKPIFLVGGFLGSLFYFRYYSKILSSYLVSKDKVHRKMTERALRRFPLHYWVVFIGYITMAPAAAIISLEITSSYIALPVDWFRIHLVALIVSIIVGLPIFISIYDLFGRAFGEIDFQKPILTIKTKVFLIGALIPLLIDTMLVQYFWTRTGFFSIETFFIWLLLECLAIAGALLFVYSFQQSLAPLKSVIGMPLDSLGTKIKASSTDELGIFANQLGKLLDEQQLHRERLSFSNELLKASHSSASLSRLLETIVNRTCHMLEGDLCFLSLYDAHKNKLICVAHSNGGYKADGHFKISLDEASIHVDVFRTSEARVVDNVPEDNRSHALLKKTYDVKSSAAVPLISDKKTIGVLQIVSTKKFIHYNQYQLNILQAYAQEAAVIQTFFEGLKYRRKAETAITQIMEAVSTAIGEDFFNAITLHMADILKADSCGIVLKIENDAENVETLSCFNDGGIIENIRYPLHGTPCATIIGKKAKTYSSKIQKTFPEDRYLCDIGMESYVGIPLFDSYSKPLGLLFSMFKKPIDDVEFNESVMHIFAARTSAEIERMQTERRIKHMAYYDGLTQLPNREFLLDRLQQAIAHAQRKQSRLAVLILDLDHFKKINDSLGHPIGDGLLIEVAKRLMSSIRKEDTVARLGGDEFVILLAGFENKESTINQVSHIAYQINQDLKKHYHISDHNLMITSSCGIAIYPDDGDSTDLLLKHADTALYKAKEVGRDSYQFFSSEMNVAAMERLEMESAIHKGLEEKQFEVAYQPKVSVVDNRIIGAEILLRWNHPEQGYISPERFVPIADETGQIIELGEFIFREACMQTSDLWCNSGCCNELYSISVNVSPRQFQQSDFVDKIKNTLQLCNTNPSCIELEVTENILIEEAHKATEKLQLLKDMGLKIAIDDFGTGYASLRYLQQLPIGMIKIDRSFITHITENSNDLSIVKTILIMAKNLDMKVIAEGVETSEQLQLLKQLGCEFYQGFLFSKPVSSEEFIELIKAQRA
jgi:diguanylate cyclase (GGDEF)-like protein